MANFVIEPLRPEDASKAEGDNGQITSFKFKITGTGLEPDYDFKVWVRIVEPSQLDVYDFEGSITGDISGKSFVLEPKKEGIFDGGYVVLKGSLINLDLNSMTADWDDTGTAVIDVNIFGDRLFEKNEIFRVELYQGQIIHTTTGNTSPITPFTLAPSNTAVAVVLNDDWPAVHRILPEQTALATARGELAELQSKYGKSPTVDEIKAQAKVAARQEITAAKEDGRITVEEKIAIETYDPYGFSEELKKWIKEAVAETNVNLAKQIEGIFIAMFGRPADPTGLAFFDDATFYGENLTAIGDLAATAEYQARFAGMSQAQVVQSIYSDLFGRDGEDAGVAFFVGELEAGRQTINSIAINILQGALGTDQQVIENKLAAVEKFLAVLDTQAEIEAYKGNAAAEIGRGFLAGITNDPATIPSDTALENVINALLAGGGGTDTSTGANIALTSATDHVSPTATDAALKSTAADDTITAPAGTLASTTTIDAGGGVDRLAATVVEPGMITPILSGVEKVFVTMAGSGAVGEINLSKTTELSEVWNKASSREFFASEISKGTKLGVEGGVQTTAFTYKAEEVGGASDSADISLKNAQSTSSLILVDVETVNLAVDGSSSIASIIFPNAETLRVTGSGDLKASFSGSHSLFEAASLNGKLDVAFTNTTKGVTFTGTSSADKVQFETGGPVLVDTIIYIAANTSTLANRDVYSGFVSGGTEDKINLSGLVLEGSKASIKTFGVAPTDGASFDGSAVGRSGSSTVYVDTNNDGILNIATDLAFDITGSAAGLTTADFIF